MYFDHIPHPLALLSRSYSFFAIKSFIATLPSARSAYRRFIRRALSAPSSSP